ncbi:MAG: glycosyltransferase [Omnitrophica WOR_2 bacterium]
MAYPGNIDWPGSATAYTAYPWGHVLTSLRIEAPLQQSGLQVVHGNEIDGFYPERVSQGDLVIVQRDFPRWGDRYEQVMGLARSLKKPVVYEIDDLLLELPADHPDLALEYYTPAVLPMLRAIIDADLVTTTTPALCEYLGMFNPQVRVLPNYLDDRLWSVQLPERNPGENPVVIGYMGSASHLADIDSITPVLAGLLESYGDRISLRFWGQEPPEPLRSHPLVEWIPLQIHDYAEFAAYFQTQTCDIAIAPLADNHFNRCKSPQKFFEYSARGIPGVYSRLDSYKQVIRQGENGFLAGGYDEWRAHLAQLVDSPELRAQIGTAAAETVSQKWLLSQHAHEWREMYARVLQEPGLQGKERPPYSEAIRQVAARVQGWQASQERRLAQQEQTIQALDNRLAEIQRSAAWKLVQALWKVRLALAPQGSRREKIVQNLRRRSGSG